MCLLIIEYLNTHIIQMLNSNQSQRQLICSGQVKMFDNLATDVLYGITSLPILWSLGIQHSFRYISN